MSEPAPISSVFSGPSGASRSSGRLSTSLDAQQEFAAVLGRHHVGPTSVRTSPAQAARAAAEEFVSVAMVQPILAQARESSGAAEPFAPTSAQKQFGALQDASLAQRITKAAHFPLVDRLAKDLLKGRATS